MRLFCKFFLMRKRRYLRRLMRGYAWSNRHDGFSAIRKLKNGLVKISIDSVPVNASMFYGVSAPHIETVVRQFIFDRYGGGKLNWTLFEYLGCGKSIRAALPPTWRDYLSANGWPINRLACSLAWQFTMLLRFAQGVLYIIRLIAKLSRQTTKPEEEEVSPYVYFEGLNAGNLPVASGQEHSYDICSFYARWPGRLAGIRSIAHGVPDVPLSIAAGLPVRYHPAAYELAGRETVISFALWGAWASLYAAVQLLAGRWSYSLLLAEAAKARAVRLCSPCRLAAEYLFHASGAIYQPMWTYEARRHEARIALYFYSTTVQPKLARGYESQLFEWGPSVWPRYIVWNTCQEAMLRRDLGERITVTTAGSIYFSDSSKTLPSMPPNPVAIFDIQPHRPSAHFGISTLADCLAQHPDFYSHFLQDVAEVVAECGGSMVLKGKRDIAGRGDKRYKRLLDKLVTSHQICLVDPAISAMRVIAGCRAGISVPLTSTAIYVREQGLPSVYYDPVGWIQKDDLGAHGIPILSGKEELRAWVTSVLARSVAQEVVSGN